MRDVDGLAKLVDGVFGSSKQDKLGHEGVHIMEKDANVSSNANQCFHKVADDHFTTVVKVFGIFGVVLYNAHTIKALKAKHLYKLPPFMSTIVFSEVPLGVEVDIVFRCIKSFSKGTSYGKDGLWA